MTGWAGPSARLSAPSLFRALRSRASPRAASGTPSGAPLRLSLGRSLGRSLGLSLECLGVPAFRRALALAMTPRLDFARRLARGLAVVRSAIGRFPRRRPLAKLAPVRGLLGRRQGTRRLAVVETLRMARSGRRAPDAPPKSRPAARSRAARGSPGSATSGSGSTPLWSCITCPLLFPGLFSLADIARGGCGGTVVGSVCAEGPGRCQ
jgi:hypothetical protein